MIVRSVCTLFGGKHKHQRQNFVRVPAGAVGYACCSIIDEYGVESYICKFDKIYVRCARNTFVIQNDA